MGQFLKFWNPSRRDIDASSSVDRFFAILLLVAGLTSVAVQILNKEIKPGVVIRAEIIEPDPEIMNERK